MAIEDQAEHLNQAITHGTALPTLSVPGLDLAPNEVAHADVMCGTARYYATHTVVPPEAGYYEVHPAFGRRWMPNRRLNARRHREAEAAAQLQWRDHDTARVLLTSVGLRLCPSGTALWLPFDHSLLTGITNGATAGEVVLSYSSCPPLLLVGPWADLLADTIRRLLS
ncbi:MULTISPECIES: hypothetical protein [Streptacidiphilus]|uniref:Uncharacterized protein n=1 Tax=Streptacidiphilus cavernicola TaxID=3342716 RepID=A0ABV6UP36_9ACTN|nr:hypothetical protein [Streptacidiphilus jeojiense]